MKNHNRGSYYYAEEGQDAPSGTRRLKYLLLIIFIIVCMLVMILLHINQYAQLSRKNLQIEKLKEKRNQLKTETAHLRLKVSKLMSLERIERIAKEDLNMKHPEEINYVVLKDNASTGDSNSTPTKREKVKTRVAEKSWPQKVGNWFKNLANVQADTLDKQEP